MLHTDTDPPAFESGPLVPVATYLLVVAVLSGLLFVSSGPSPPPVFGMAWGVFLVVLAFSALMIEGVSLRSIRPPARTLLPATAVLIGFWALYNLVAYALALGGVPGFEATWSRVAARPLLYLAALFSSFLFTAIPEEFVFRIYLQQKLTALAGGDTRRALITGISLVAVLFALFHVPRWILTVEYGASTALAGRLLSLTLLGLAYGGVYALTRNLWLVALFHATMNHPPLIVTVDVPSELHLVVGVVEYAALLSVVYLTVRTTEPDRPTGVWTPRETSSASD